MSTSYQATVDAVYRKVYNIVHDTIMDDYRRRLDNEPGTIHEAEARRAAGILADAVWPEVYRYRRLYDEVSRQIMSLYQWADEHGVQLPDAGVDHT